MHTITSFHASILPPEDVSAILADYLALDRVRIYRRLFVTRFGLLAFGAFVIGLLVPGLSPYARWVPVALFLAPPVLAWIRELRLKWRIAARLGQETTGKKVVKSS